MTLRAWILLMMGVGIALIVVDGGKAWAQQPDYQSDRWADMMRELELESGTGTESEVAPASLPRTTPNSEVSPSQVPQVQVKPPPARCKVYYHACPGNETLALAMQKWCDGNYDVMKKWLDPKEQSKLRLSFVPSSQMYSYQDKSGKTHYAPAQFESGADTIKFHCAYFAGNNHDLGVLYHEMAHFFTKGLNWNGDEFWLREGVADYVRHQIEGVESKCSVGETYLNGYSCTAAFLKYLERKHNPRLMHNVFASIRRKGNVVGVLKSNLPAGLDVLWEQYREELEQER